MGMLNEFKQFAMRGNVVDLAVGVIIGGAFGKIVSSFVSDILMPPIGALLGGTDFTGLKLIIKDKVVDASGKILSQPVTLNYGNFIQITIDFIIIAFSVFMMIKMINTVNKKEIPPPPAPAEPSAEEKLLTEIRDLLKNQGS